MKTLALLVLLGLGGGAHADVFWLLSSSTSLPVNNQPGDACELISPGIFLIDDLGVPKDPKALADYQAKLKLLISQIISTNTPAQTNSKFTGAPANPESPVIPFTPEEIPYRAGVVFKRVKAENALKQAIRFASTNEILALQRHLDWHVHWQRSRVEILQTLEKTLPAGDQAEQRMYQGALNFWTSNSVEKIRSESKVIRVP